MVKTANTNPNLNTDLKAIFDSIEGSANGYASEKTSKDCLLILIRRVQDSGIPLKIKIVSLAAVLKGVAGLNFGSFAEHEIDLFGDAYEYLINNYAANAGKSGGEFFTPQNVSKLISLLPCITDVPSIKYTTLLQVLVLCCYRQRSSSKII